MTDAEQLKVERNTIFVLAGLLLASIVSIAFFNLDRHPAFPPPSEEFIDEVASLGSTVVFAHDPLAISVLEQHQSELPSAVVPLTTWPPEGPVVTFGNQKRKFSSHTDLQHVAGESVWSLWIPEDFQATPFFGTAIVEIDDGSMTTICPQTSAGAHRCGEPRWTWVRRRELTIDGESQQCIWAHPIEDKTIRIRFPDTISVGADGERLRLESALRDDAVGTGADVDFRVHLANISRTHRHRDRPGWQSLILPATEEPDELIVEVSADRVGRRHICFRFDLR